MSMQKIFVFLALGACLAASGREWCRAVAQEAPAKKDFEVTLRKLEKEIAAVRGLEFKSPVAAKVIARPAEVAKSMQGYYSIKDKTLHVYNDIAGAYERDEQAPFQACSRFFLCGLRICQSEHGEVSGEDRANGKVSSIANDRIKEIHQPARGYVED